MLFLRLLAHALAIGGIRGVGIILVDSEGRFLVNRRGRLGSKPEVGQRRARALLARRWAILAGGVEPGETPEEAALREIREETGLQPGRLHPVVRASWPRRVYLYAAGLPVTAEGLILGEGTEHRLVPLDDVARLSPRAPLLPAVLRAFARTPTYRDCLADARRS